VSCPCCSLGAWRQPAGMAGNATGSPTCERTIAGLQRRRRACKFARQLLLLLSLSEQSAASGLRVSASAARCVCETFVSHTLRRISAHVRAVQTVAAPAVPRKPVVGA
jgi:hypothetical protein